MSDRSPNRPLLLGHGVAIAVFASILAGCAHMGRLGDVPNKVSPVITESTALERTARAEIAGTWDPLLGDTLVGLIPGTADTARRYLGRLRTGYTADTLNILVFGDNRPGWRVTRLAPEYATISQMFSPSPMKILKGLVAIPTGLVKGLYPDLALLRDIPGRLSHSPTWGPEAKVVAAMVDKVDSLRAHGEYVAAVINSGDLVNDGRYPSHWQRFLKIHKPLDTRVPCFAVPGNHERTDTEDGVANWRSATGLPTSGDRLYYCFDTADGWVRFIALDSNPMADPAHLWTREVQIKYSDEEINWMVARLKEHRGPAFIFMHHPPFSVGFHHDEWQADSVLVLRRERMMNALHEAGIGVLVAGHVHAYERALFTWKDAVLVVLVSGGGGAPLHQIPSPALAAQQFAEYKVANSTVDPANVVTGSFNNFIHLRMWFGGGELYTYSVDKNAKSTLADKVRIDLTRFGIPKIDEHKVPILPKPSGTGGPHEENMPSVSAAQRDSVANSKRILTTPSPREAGRRQVRHTVAVLDSAATARRDSLAVVRRDSLAARRRIAPATHPATTPHR